MKIELFAIVTIVLVIPVSIVSLSYGQLSQYMDPQDPSNLTALCNNYYNSGLALPGDVLNCADYLNDTVLAKYGIVPPTDKEVPLEQRNTSQDIQPYEFPTSNDEMECPDC
jgi:hypothetical protein